MTELKRVIRAFDQAPRRLAWYRDIVDPEPTSARVERRADETFTVMGLSVKPDLTSDEVKRLVQLPGVLGVEAIELVAGREETFTTLPNNH